MTDLTEQWKNWQLEGFRWYYVKFKTGDIDSCWLTEWSNDELGTGGQYFDGINEETIKEVLAPVPTFEEWQASEKYNKHLEEVIKVYERKDKQATETSIAYSELLEENEKLKELLNKAFVYVHHDCLKNLRVGYTPRSSFLIRDIKEALKDYRRKNAIEFIYVEDNKDER